jgi:protein O-mannosyl-transferase
MRKARAVRSDAAGDARFPARAADGKIAVVTVVATKPPPAGPSSRSLQRTRVLVVDDHEMVRTGLTAVIQQTEDLEICGAADSASAALEAAGSAQPDVVVADWSLGSHDAAALVALLRVAHPATAIVVLSMHDEMHYAARAAEAGASGYVMKHEASGRILAAIRAVAAGETFFSKRAAETLARNTAAATVPLAPSPARGRAVRVADARIPSWTARSVVAAIFGAIGFALYEFTLPFPFAFDDYPYLLKNPLWKDARSFLFPTEFSQFANRAAALGLVSDLSTNFILRPFAYLTFHLNYLAGGLEPAGYRAVNVLIHSANAVLLFALVSLLGRLPGQVAPPASSRRFVPWVAALIFLVHPMQIESVTYIIQRFTSLGTFFFLGSVLLFLMARIGEDRPHARRCRRCSIAALLLGMLTKEFLFVAPLAMLMLDRLMLGTPPREALQRARPWLLCMPLIPALVLATAAAQSPHGLSMLALLNVTSPTASGHSDAQYLVHYALTQPGIVLTYLRLLVLPRGLNVDPDHPFVTSPLDGQFLAPSAALMLIAGSAAWWAGRRPGDPRTALACSGVLWFFLTLSVDSSIIPLPDVMAEHRAYLPSVGFAIAVACLADLARTRRAAGPVQQWSIAAGTAAAVLSLAVGTAMRNEVWRSPVSLWQDTAAKSPGKSRPWMNLGTAYFESERWSLAIECYRRAVALAPSNAELWAYLAIAENAAGRFERALATAQQGLRLDPTAERAFLAAAFACERLGRPHDALVFLREWVRQRPASRHARLGLAGSLVDLGDDSAALRELQELRTFGLLQPEERATSERLEAALAARRRPPDGPPRSPP